MFFETSQIAVERRLRLNLLDSPPWATIHRDRHHKHCVGACCCNCSCPHDPRLGKSSKELF